MQEQDGLTGNAGGSNVFAEALRLHSSAQQRTRFEASQVLSRPSKKGAEYAESERAPASGPHRDQTHRRDTDKISADISTGDHKAA